jgi:hypothetical protein
VNDGPLSLLKMMRRFARVNPTEPDKIKARALDPVTLKNIWITISDEAEAKMTRLADEQPDVPIGVAFVDQDGRPSWLGGNAGLRVHRPSIRGCWPTVHGSEQG